MARYCGVTSSYALIRTPVAGGMDSSAMDVSVINRL